MSLNAPENKRQVIFEARTEQDLLAGLRAIPGFAFRNARSDETRAQEANVYILEGAGQSIWVLHNAGALQAKTSNVLPQDAGAEPTPFEKDALVALARAAIDSTALSVYPVMSDAELKVGKLAEIPSR